MLKGTLKELIKHRGRIYNPTIENLYQLVLKIKNESSQQFYTNRSELKIHDFKPKRSLEDPEAI